MDIQLGYVRKAEIVDARRYEMVKWEVVNIENKSEYVSESCIQINKQTKKCTSKITEISIYINKWHAVESGQIKTIRECQ